MKIALLGDIALFGRNTVADGSYKRRFEPMRHLLADCDYVIGNLETPLTYSNHPIGGKSAYIKGSPDDVEILTYLGVTHVSLANNHMFDYGQQGINDTIISLNNSGIEWFGINKKKVKIEKSGNKVVLLGYCCFSTNGKGMGRVDILDPAVIENDIYNNEDTLLILSFHWGQEHVHYPNYDHIEVARKLCKDRQIVIHGHHPHVIQGIEKINNSLIAYSLGNFCFDDVYTNKSIKPLVKLSSDNKESFILVLEVNNNKVCDYYVVPFSFNDRMYSINTELQVRIDEWSVFLSIDKDLFNEKRSRDLLDYYNSRKALRNFQWYLKRLNCESVKMMLSAHYNKKQYEDLIKRYIS